MSDFRSYYYGVSLRNLKMVMLQLLRLTKGMGFNYGFDVEISARPVTDGETIADFIVTVRCKRDVSGEEADAFRSIRTELTKARLIRRE